MTDLTMESGPYLWGDQANLDALAPLDEAFVAEQAAMAMREAREAADAKRLVILATRETTELNATHITFYTTRGRRFVADGEERTFGAYFPNWKLPQLQSWQSGMLHRLYDELDGALWLNRVMEGIVMENVAVITLLPGESAKKVERVIEQFTHTLAVLLGDETGQLEVAWPDETDEAWNKVDWRVRP